MKTKKINIFLIIITLIMVCGLCYGVYIQETSEKKTIEVPCYDKHNSEIKYTICTKEIYSDKTSMFLYKYDTHYFGFLYIVIVITLILSVMMNFIDYFEK